MASVLTAPNLLDPGAGTVVRDAKAATILTLTTASSDQTATAWTAVPFTWEHSVFLDVGAVTGTSVVCDVQVEAADDSSGTNSVVLGKFATVDENDDNTSRVLEVSNSKQYMRAIAYISGTTPSVTATVKVREKHDRRSDTRTA